MDDPNQIISPDNTPKDDPQIDTREYQEILNKYAQEISKNPPEIQTPPPAETELPPQEIQLSELPPAPPIQPNEVVSPQTPPSAPEFEFPQIPPEPPPALPPTPPISPSPSGTLQHELPPPGLQIDDIEPPEDEEAVLPSKPNPFVKILFFLSLLIFLAVSVGLVYVYFVLPIQMDEQSSAPLIQNTPTSIPSGVCLLNDQSYNVGESFTAADGCNTCTCQEDLTISCTEIACDSPSSAIPSDWKTYTNSSFGITIKYPQAGTIKNEMDDQYNRNVAFIGDNLDFTVTLRKAGPNFILNKYFFMDSPISRTSTLGGKEANVYELPKGYCDGPSCSQPYIAIVTEHNGNIYSLAFFGDSKLSDQESQILSTFKFTN